MRLLGTSFKASELAGLFGAEPAALPPPTVALAFLTGTGTRQKSEADSVRTKEMSALYLSDV